MDSVNVRSIPPVSVAPTVPSEPAMVPFRLVVRLSGNRLRNGRISVLLIGAAANWASVGLATPAGTPSTVRPGTTSAPDSSAETLLSSANGRL